MSWAMRAQNTVIGLKRGKVKLVKSTSVWRESFKKEHKKLKKLFGKDVLDIQHVGSTAIPGISAKPIIDIGMIVPSLQKARRYAAALKKIGYIKKKENRHDRLFFTKGSEKKRTQYLHIGEIGSGYVENMILFRDYLKKNKKAAREYVELKRELVERFADKRYIYTEKKEKFVKSIVKKVK